MKSILDNFWVFFRGFSNAFRSCQLGGTNFVNDGPYKPKLTKIVIKPNFIALRSLLFGYWLEIALDRVFV